MTHAQFLQKEIISLAEEMKWWYADRPVLCPLPQSLLQDDRASCIFLIHSGQEAVGDLYPLTKKNLPFQHVNAWNNFAKVLPGGRVERGGGGTKPRNAKTTPLF